MVYELTIKGRFANANEYNNQQRRNFYAGNNMKKQTERVMMDEIEAQLGDVHLNPPVRFIVTYYEPNKRRDLDNVSSYFMKCFLDTLQKAGVIDNDSFKYVQEIHSIFGLDKEEPHIHVLIEEMGNQ